MLDRTRRRTPTLLGLALVAMPAAAQPHVAAGQLERRLATLTFAGDLEPHGQVAIEYGAPTWRAEYSHRLQEGAAQSFRLGRDHWTTLHTTLPLELGGATVPAGTWYLGLHRDATGQWFLTCLSPARAAAAEIGPGLTEAPPVDHRAPLSWAPRATSSTQLAIEFAPVPGQPGQAALTLTWGDHSLHAELAAPVQPRAPVGVAEFRPLDAAAARRTESGLEYEIVGQGDGTPPTVTDTVEVRYTGWLADGTLFDSTRDRSIRLPVARVIPG